MTLTQVAGAFAESERHVIDAADEFWRGIRRP